MVDGSHLHSQRDGVLVLAVRCAVVLCGRGGLQAIKAKRSAERSFVKIGEVTGLLREVVPVDVVAVGVSPWTLDVYPMALQDCGFLEKEDGSLDL